MSRTVSLSAVDLTSPLGSGGTATIFPMSDPNQAGIVAKIYKSPEKSNVDKLIRIVSRGLDGQHSDNFGYPLGVVYENDQCVGYTMPYFDARDHTTLDAWVEQTMAAHLDPAIRTLRFRCSILRSLASLLMVLHKAHVAVVDLKPSNVLVNLRTGNCALIDCDSFCVLDESDQVEFGASEISIGYQDPRTVKAGQPVETLSFSQDQYAYSVIAFQLLNYGIHPYQFRSFDDRGQFDLQTLSTRGIWAYCAQPPEGVLPAIASVHETFPAILSEAFDRSFHGSESRLPIESWHRLWTQIISADLFEPCHNQPSNLLHEHFRDYPCPECLRNIAFELVEKRPSTAPPLTESALPEVVNGRQPSPRGLFAGLLHLVNIAVPHPTIPGILLRARKPHEMWVALGATVAFVLVIVFVLIRAVSSPTP